MAVAESYYHYREDDDARARRRRHERKASAPPRRMRAAKYCRHAGGLFTCSALEAVAVNADGTAPPPAAAGSRIRYWGSRRASRA